jgi:hypothetical protein
MQQLKPKEGCVHGIFMYMTSAFYRIVSCFQASLFPGPSRLACAWSNAENYEYMQLLQLLYKLHTTNVRFLCYISYDWVGWNMVEPRRAHDPKACQGMKLHQLHQLHPCWPAAWQRDYHWPESFLPSRAACLPCPYPALLHSYLFNSVHLSFSKWDMIKVSAGAHLKSTKYKQVRISRQINLQANWEDVGQTEHFLRPQYSIWLIYLHQSHLNQACNMDAHQYTLAPGPC